jgi:hypothetical protein
MKIELKEITIQELTTGYEDRGNDGVIGYNGNLDIRPPYQREFIYKDKQREAVIDTITKDYPLNVMYWAKREDGGFEVIDGQQRTISISQFISGDFAYQNRYFHNLQSNEQNQILNYKLMVYVCSGDPSEKLEWFRTINIAGEQLTNQELNNAVYSGSWVTDAKRYFSKPNCAAYGIASDYLTGSPIRQDFLETALNWISKGNIIKYMAQHQHDATASELWLYFQSVITWVEMIFKVKRTKFMKGVDWGKLYDDFHNQKLDPNKIEEEIKKLILDDDVTKKSGIYPFVLTRNEKYLSIRTFTDAMKEKVYIKQNGICVVCSKSFSIDEMEADHITPWSKGGKTNEDNCQLLCQEDNRRKSNI